MPAGAADHAEARSFRPTTDPPNLRGTVLARPDPRQQFDVKVLDRFHGDKDEQ